MAYSKRDRVAEQERAGRATAVGVSRRTLDYHIARLGMRELQSALWPRSVRQPKRRTQPS